MDVSTIVRLLKNAGLNAKPDATQTYLLLEDPSCIMRSFQTFLEYAWVIVSLIAAILLFGWAISKIRGANTDIVTNIRNLLIMFGVLSATGPIVNIIYGDDLMARTCNTVKIPLDDVQKMLLLRKSQLGQNDGLFEEIDIFDSGMRTNSVSGQNLAPVDVPEYTFQKDKNTGDPILVYGAQNSTPPVSHTQQNTNNQTENPDITNNTDEINHNPSSYATNVPVSARVISNKVIEYTRSDGTKYRNNAGSPAWRHTNPGNIVNSAFAISHGAIGRGKKFAIFPSKDIGIKAIISLLRSSSYRNLSIINAIRRYAPAADNNNPEKYARDLSRATGLDIYRILNTLTDAEMRRVADEIQRIEGWHPGTITQ